jgi:osmotically inducible lipoprotein OsmB
MNKFVMAVVVASAAGLSLAGCGGRGETVGTLGGAAVGGAVGSSVTGGGTLGTLGGAAAGGYIGNKAGEDYDKKHPR